MKEYFISYYRIDYPICRACWNTDFDTIQIQKNKDCFTALSDNCDERSPYCNWDDCNSCPCTCLTEPCPLQTRVLHCRCSIGELLENEIEYFERKSRIEENPDYVLHKDIALETIDERHEHMKSLQEFSRYCEERDSDDIDIVFLFRPIPHIDSMVQFIILAQEIRALRKKKPAITVKPTEPAHADSPSQIKAEHNVPIAPADAPIFIAASEKKKSAMELYNEGKPSPEPDFPEDVNIKNTNDITAPLAERLDKISDTLMTKEDMKDAVRYGIREGLLDTDALSQKARDKAIRTRQEDMLLESGRTPAEIARMHNRDASVAEQRTAAQRISNERTTQKKT